MRSRTQAIIAVIFAIMLLWQNAGADPGSPAETRILLVGNSIIYTNNLPAILTRLAEANGKPVTADMITRGGARVSDHLKNGLLVPALKNDEYDYVIFHDRGGDAFCAAGNESLEPDCQQMIEDHREIARLAADNGAVPYLLGTYQGEHVSSRLVQGEQRIARGIDVEHIEISNRWHKVRDAAPQMPWFAEDGMHPGEALTTLMAIEIYRTVFGGYPQASEISITLPLYVPRDKMQGVVKLDELPHGDAELVLSKKQVQEILSVLSGS